jgi:hypothetical protein
MATFSTPSIQNDPIYALPHLYISGMNISYASTTVIAIAPGQARDGNDIIDMPISFPDANNNINPAILFQNYQQPILINSTVNGINGLDTGTIAASTQYAIYVIGDSRGYNLVGGLLSLTSNAAPTLPFGYDSYRLLGFTATDGSSHFVYSTQKPQNMKYALQYVNSPAITVLTGGNATTFTAIDLTTNSAIPTTTLPNVIVDLFVTFTPAAAGDIVQFRPTGSSATGGLVTITGAAAGYAQTQYIQAIAGVGSSKPEIDYKVTSSSDAVTVAVASWIGVSNTAYPALV